MEDNKSFLDRVFNAGTKVFEGLTDLESQRRELQVLRETRQLQEEALDNRNNKYAGVTSVEQDPVTGMQTKEIIILSAAGVIGVAGLFLILRK